MEEALSLYGSCQNREGEAIAHTNLGLLYYDVQEWKQALASHQNAYRISSELSDLAGMARARHNAALVLQRQGKMPEAEASCQEAIALYEKTHSRFYLRLVLMDLGNIYLTQNRPGQAETLYRQAIEALQRAGNPRGLAQALNNLGMACARQDKWKLAEESFQRSIALWQQLGQPVRQANAQDNLAEAYLAQKNWASARRVLNQALEELGRAKGSVPANRLLAEIQAHLKEADAGLQGHADQG